MLYRPDTQLQICIAWSIGATKETFGVQGNSGVLPNGCFGVFALMLRMVFSVNGNVLFAQQLFHDNNKEKTEDLHYCS